MADVQGLKLATDKRCWMLSRLLPQRFGDFMRVAHAHAHAVEILLPDNGRLVADDNPALLECQPDEDE